MARGDWDKGDINHSLLQDERLYEEWLTSYSPRVSERIIEIIGKLKLEESLNTSQDSTKFEENEEDDPKKSTRAGCDYNYEVFRRTGVGPFILGILAGAAKSSENTRELLGRIPWWKWRTRRYYEAGNQGR